MPEVALARTQIDTFVACPCGRTAPAGAADEEGSREYTCGGCGTTYTLRWSVTISRAPDDRQTGRLDLLGHLRQSLRDDK